MPDRTRKGARTPALVSLEIRESLESGQVASVNHMEQMALDMGSLLAQAFPDLASEADRLRAPRFLDRLRAGGQVLNERLGEAATGAALSSASDTVRGWGAFAAVRPGMDCGAVVAAVLPFANDPHFAVREWAWLAARPVMVAKPVEVLAALTPLAASDSARVRRFASELSRPRGVWSAHVPLLKERPWAALGLLDALVTDTDPYVSTSIGNWLNDAAKSQPGWVRARCGNWLATHGDGVGLACRRGLRSLTPAADVERGARQPPQPSE